MAATPETVLFAAAAVIVLGFLGQLLFRATRISDILLLIGLGFLLGLAIDQFRVLDRDVFTALAPVVGTFALLVILFEGGLDLRIRELLHGLGRAAVLAVLGFGLTVAAVSLTAIHLLDLDAPRGLLLGCILGGSSSIAVVPLLRRLAVSDRTRVILSVESALTDVFCVVGALTVASILALQQQPDVASVGRTVASSFIIAVFFGIVAGLLWLKFLDSGLTREIGYMLTLATLLGLHVAVSALGGNGPVAVLAFGVVLGNALGLRKVLQLETEGFRPELRVFQGEVAFVTRAFFFVYLGLILDPTVFAGPVLWVSLALVAALALARGLAVFASAAGSRQLESERAVWWAMMPRGLAAAVLASVPSLTFGIPETAAFVSYAAVVIILTNVVGSLAGLLPSPGKARAPTSDKRRTAREGRTPIASWLLSRSRRR